MVGQWNPQVRYAPRPRAASWLRSPALKIVAEPVRDRTAISSGVCARLITLARLTPSAWATVVIRVVVHAALRLRYPR